MDYVRIAAIFALSSAIACGDSSSPSVNGPADTGVSADTGNSTNNASDVGTQDASVTTDAGTDGDSPDSSMPCTDCLYQPDETYTVSAPLTFDSISYTDVLGQPRNLAVAIYRPVGVTTAMPLIVLSHGGSSGKMDPLTSMDKWAPAFAKAGYLAVAIAHSGRTQASYDALCAEIGFTSTAIMCAAKVDWDRPHDVATVLDWLEARTQPGEPIEGRIDWTRVGHAGHSAGAGAALMLAGVSRNYVCAQPFGMDQGSVVPCDPADLVRTRESRVKAVLAMSPQGIDSAGFMTESYANVEAPILMATGTRDGDPGEPDNRKTVYDNVPQSSSGYDFGRFYVEDPGAKHTLFEGETDACVREGATLERCEEIRSWLYSMGVAWFDAHLRGSSRAIDWLKSDNLAQASGGAGTFELK